MIDFNAVNTEQNARILLTGMWYLELPPLLDYECLQDNIIDVLKKIETRGYGYFNYTADAFVEDIKKITPPDYIRGCGCEAITYYAFKKNGSFREMQIPNLIHYSSFIYDSLYVFQDVR